MTAKLTRHLVDWYFCRHELMQAPAVGEGSVRIASRHAKIYKVKPLELLACRTWKVNAPIML